MSKSLKAQNALIKAWREVAIGTPIKYQKVRGGEEFDSSTASSPFLLGDHTACIMLNGVSGAYGLDFIRLSTPVGNSFCVRCGKVKPCPEHFKGL